ncbi:MAG TPA: hypothetical protein VFO40_04890 [Chthoniobacterales bacterium]|nr:hypothetical protein [Chthoniobacterales bacterium]
MTLYIKYEHWPTFALAEHFDSRAEIIELLDMLTDPKTIAWPPIALVIK